MTTPITRRTVLASVATAGVLTAAGMSPAEASRRRPPHRPGTPVKLTIMGTTDLHGCVFNWDYFKNAEYNDSVTNDIGLASTHPDVRDHLSDLYAALMELTEAVLDAAGPRKLDRDRRKAAAGTFVAVLLHQASSQRFDGTVPDLGATAEIVSGALGA